MNRVEGVRAVIASEHSTRGEVVYAEPPGIELHRTVVVSSEATNQKKGLNHMRATRTSLR